MPYLVAIPKRVKKQLKRIDNEYRLKISVALMDLAFNPFLGKKLEGKYKNKWSLRVWPYRIIYKIEKRKLIILILEIAHRQGAYK